MTKDELRKIFDEAEQKVKNPEVYNRLLASLTGEGKPLAESKEEFSIRVNRALEREILLEVLVRVLGI